MIRVVLFDVGGVLLELSGVSTFREWLGNRLTPEEIWRRWLTSPAVRAFETGQIESEPFADRLIDEFALPVERRQLLDAFTAWPHRSLPGAADLVGRVDRRFVRATLCNTNVLHWPRFHDDFGFGKLFDHHFASHLIGKLKPDLAVFEHVIAALQCDPSEILFLDDQPLNVQSAKRAGMQSVLAVGVDAAERILSERGVLDGGQETTKPEGIANS